MPNPTSKLNLVINGATTQLDIHDANAVDLSSNQTVGGDKEFIGTTTAHDLVPSATDTYNFGSPSYQWNNAYIKSYYYNGARWGLDQANTWTAHQKVVGNNSRGVVSIYNPAYTKGSELSVSDLLIGTIFMGNGGQEGLANTLGFVSTDLASNGTRTLLSLSAMENTASSGKRTNVVIQYDKNDEVDPRKVSIQGSVFPHANATYSLGTSTLKWKSFNGVEPSDLSLPSDTSITIDTTSFAWGRNFTFTPSVNGHLFININNSNGIKSLLLKTGRGEYYFTNQIGILRFTFPVYKNKLVTILANSSMTETMVPSLLLFPLQGNV